MPLRISVPPPCLTSPPVPLMVEAKVTMLSLVSKVAPAAPSGASFEEMSAVLPAAHCRPPPFKVIAPVPKLSAAREVDQAAASPSCRRE